MTNELEQRLHEQLCAYVLDECTSDERLEIERELMRSPELRAQRDAIERTVGLVKDALGKGESLSAEAAETVISAASASKPSTWYAVPWLRIAAGLSAVALSIAIVQRSGRHADSEVARLDDADRYGFGARPASERALRDDDALERAAKADDESGRRNGVDRDESNAKNPEPSIGGLPADGRDASAGTIAAQGRWASADIPPGKKEELRIEDRQRTRDLSTVQTVPVDIAAAAQDPAASAKVPITNSSMDSATKDKRGGTAIGAGDAGHKGAPPANPADSTGSYRKSGASTVPGLASAGNPPSGPATGGAPAGSPAGVDNLYLARAPAEKAEGKHGEVAPDAGLLAGKPAEGRGAARPSATPSTPPSAPAPSAAPPAGAIKFGYAGESKSDESLKKSREFERTRRERQKDAGPSGGVQQIEESFEEAQVLYYKLPPADQQVYLDRECRRILNECVRRPNERPRDMYFRFWGDNPFEVTALDPLSTFSADVDTASYTLARRYLNEGNVPEKAQIRTEEFVNYFKSDTPAPTVGVFAIQTNLAPSRFSTDATRQMLRVVVRGKDLSKLERKPLNLTFVVDVSGSMREQNRLEMVKHSMRLLVTQLDQYDKIAIVKFSNDASTVLPLTPVTDRAKIESAIQPLTPEGGTNSNAGLELGYGIADHGLDPNATNRVVFLSDGVANVGETDPAKIAEHVKPMREKGIYLNTIGVGMNNHNDVLLEQLADKADGMCNYIDSPAEAQRALVDNFTGAFQPIARDVKIQVEFDPQQVLRYRLLGYENRAIADADFRNDRVDAGELGAGHQVTALYEIDRQLPMDFDKQAASNEIPIAGKPFATVRVRWKEPRNFGTNAEQDTATEMSHPVFAAQASTFEGAGQSFRKAAMAAQFAEILRRSLHARGDSLDDLLNESLKLQREIPNDADFNEFVQLVSKSRTLIVNTMPACDELCQAIDSVRENQYRRAQIEQFQKEMDQKAIDDLKRQNDQLEARLREIVRHRLENQGR